MKKLLIVIFIFALYSCEKEVYIPNISSVEYKNKVIGVWAMDSTDNGDMFIDTVLFDEDYMTEYLYANHNKTSRITLKSKHTVSKDSIFLEASCLTCNEVSYSYLLTGDSILYLSSNNYGSNWYHKVD